MEKEACFSLRLAARFFEVDVMDRNQPSNTQDERFYPVPHSHWFPRPIAFRAYNSSGAGPQQDAGLKGARRLHIQVSRPVSLYPYLELTLCFVATKQDHVMSNGLFSPLCYYQTPCTLLSMLVLMLEVLCL